MFNASIMAGSSRGMEKYTAVDLVGLQSNTTCIVRWEFCATSSTSLASVFFYSQAESAPIPTPVHGRKPLGRGVIARKETSLGI